MPVIKIFASDALLQPDPLAQERLASAITGACTEILRAALTQIQIMLIPVQTVLRGEKIYIEVNFRDTGFRSADVVDAFMTRLESEVVGYYATLPRIRCFAENQAVLFARN
jgi:hypothetical protein